MRTAAEHVRAFPKCRSTTLTDLIAKERMTAQLQREVAAKRSPLMRLWLSLRSHVKGGVRHGPP